MIKKILYNSGAQIVGKGISLLISLGATAVLTRRLGVSGYGRYALVISFINLLVALANWGTQIIGVRELAKAKNKGAVFGSLICLRLALAAGATVIGLCLILLLPLFNDVKLLAIISLPLTLGIITEVTFEVVFQTFVKMGIKSIINITSSAIFLLATLFFLRSNLGVLAPIFAWFVAKITAIFLSNLFSKGLIKEKPKPDPAVVKDLLKDSLPLGALLVLFAGYDQAVDSMMIKSFLGSSSVGIYSFAYKIYSNLVMPAYFLSNTIFPMLSKNKGPRFRKILALAAKLTILGLLVLVPSTMALSRPVTLLIAGQRFAASVPVLRTLSLALIFSSINHLTGFSLIALKRQVDSLKFGLIALIWNISLNLIFIPRYGIMAAAWITVSTEALVSLLSLSSLLKRVKKRESVI